jgi:hypothetical protein
MRCRPALNSILFGVNCFLGMCRWQVSLVQRGSGSTSPVSEPKVPIEGRPSPGIRRKNSARPRRKTCHALWRVAVRVAT